MIRRVQPLLLCAISLLCLAAPGTAAVSAIPDTPAIPDAAGEAAARMRRARRIAAAMDDRTLAAQVILTGIDGKAALPGAMTELLRAVPAGGIMLFRYNLSIEKDQIAPFLASIVSLVADASGVPPFMAVDHEGGAVHRFGAGVGRLPPPLSYWEQVPSQGREAVLEAVETAAFQSAREIRALGVTVNLAPVAEVLTDENRPFLDDRSYGPDAAFVEAAAAAFIRGMEKGGILSVVKHFPGNTGEDPHKNAASLAADRDALKLMIEPMAALLQTEHPPMVMISHALVRAWDSEQSASLSPAVIGNWLRGELGYSGVVLADDFSMGGVIAPLLSAEQMAVAALNAGVDMVMAWPRNLTATHRAIRAAITENRLSRERLREAAARIISEKIRAGIIGAEGNQNEE
ncbi:glycosyl hydrolase [Spirochaetia bacterium]|nr:glycosyl hydrolase [Spirochaetia bacterium]